MPLRAVVEDRIKSGMGWALLAIALVSLPLRSWGQAAVAPGAATEPRITAAIDETHLTTLRGNTHPLARPQFDQGAAPSALPMRRMLLVLRRSPAQEAALAALLEQQEDPGSPNYRHWLTPAQMGQQFGPADQDIQTVTSWLGSHGFQVARVAQSRMVIEFSGTASQVLQAFHTQIHKYTVSGKDHWANASDPQIPMALAPVVAGIDTLHNFGRKPMHHVAGVFGRSEKTGAVQAVKPMFTFPGGCGSSASSPCYAVGPADFAKIYDVPNLLLTPAPGTLWNGDGITIAIVGESNINIQDVQDFRSMFGLPAKDPVIILDGPDPGIVGGVETEADLDVEWSGAVAPNATIDLVVAQSTETSQGVDLAAEHVIDNNLAPILSESFGYCEAGLGAAGNQFYSQLWQQAAAQGITVAVSTGDSGAAGCDYSSFFPSPAQYGLQISGLASTPYNVAVGGTDFDDLNNPLTYWSASNSATLASALGYVPERTWNDSCTNSETFFLTGAVSAEPNCNSASLNAFFVNTIGGSGGKSSCINGDGTTLSSCTQGSPPGYAKPTWQTGTGVPADSRRDIPDLSLFAADGLNGNFYIICESDATGGTPCPSQFVGVGGTSASTPSFAGIMALVNQKTAARQGNANYILYKLAASTPSAFHDVTTGTIAMPCAKGTLNCTVTNGSDQYGVLSGYATTTGYDLATGLGSIDATNLVNAWATAVAALKPTATTLTLNSGNPVSITHGASVPVSITVAPTPPGTGTPTGNVSLIAATGPSGQTGVQSATLSSGSASFNTTLLPGGTYNVFARYPGDGTFAANDSTPPVSVTVTKENSRLQIGIVTFSGNVITSANATSFAYGSPYILRMDILNSTANACTPLAASPVITGCAFDARGSVSVTDTFNSVTGPLDGGAFAVNSEGYTEDQPIQLPAGTHNLSATYSGDNSYNGSGPATVTLTVSQAATATSVASSVTSIGFGGTVTLTATIGSNSNSSTGPSGTVQFLNNGSNFGAAVPCVPAGATATAGASCTATLITAALPWGTDSITAQYSGDANYQSSSTTTAASIHVLATTTTVVSTGAGANLWQGQSVTFTAAVTPNQGSGAVTGTVQFTANGTSIGSGTLSSGQAQVTTSALPLGTVQIVATYGGDSNNVSSTSAQLTETVSTAFSVGMNPNPISVSAPGTQGTATVTLTSLTTFTGTASSVACSGLPSESTCSFSPAAASVTLPAGGTATTTLTISTTAASGVGPGAGSRRTPLGWRNLPGSVALSGVLLAMLAALVVLGLRGRQRRWNFALGFAVFVLLVLNVGCGGGSGSGGGVVHNPGTPLGTYPITVTVTIGGVTQTGSVNLQVN